MTAEQIVEIVGTEENMGSGIARVCIAGKYDVAPSGCWEWKLNRGRYGYGLVSFMGSTHRAHRISWMAHRGDIPQNMYVLHKCDNRCCINPHHLFLGTAKDNWNDAKSKNRIPTGPRHWTAKQPENRPYGERNPFHKLSEQQVAIIRETSGNTMALAKRFGVSKSTICRARSGETWNYSRKQRKESEAP